MTFEEVKAEIDQIDDSIILFDGYEEALIGYGEIFASDGRHTVAAYDYDKCIEVLMKRDGMSFEDAMEFFDFNSLGCYPGQIAPVFVKVLRAPNPGFTITRKLFTKDSLPKAKKSIKKKP